MKKRTKLLLLLTLFLFVLSGCGQAAANPPAESDENAAEMEKLSAEAGEEPAEEPHEAEPYEIHSPVYHEGDPVPEGYYVFQDTVEHLFFHPVVAYPEVAFTGSMADGIDDWMVTVDEYNKILQSVYERGFVLVDINDIWRVSDDGATMLKNPLLLPEGKQPIVFSYDDTNYYPYMLENGFTYKLILGEDGTVWSYGLDPQGNEVVSQDLDAIPILDKFVREHPDFSPFGAKGCLSLTGYCGILGYRTQTDRDIVDPTALAEFEANRQREIEAVKPIIAELKRTGWTFGSHTWGHINLEKKPLATIENDMQRWLAEVGTLIGETDILFYPHGARPDGDDWKHTGEEFRYLHGLGFRVFCSVGTSSFSCIKNDICAVICDRLHPDGTTLRSAKALATYDKFYDTKSVIDLNVRPKRAVHWME